MQESNSKAIKIGKNVWIGRGCAILKGGYGAVVDTNSVVTKNVETNTVVGGYYAKFIKKRPKREDGNS